jgi:hypothetical protein
MRNMKPCWSCGAKNRACFAGCECAKCVDPIDYSEWKNNNPEEYQEWLDENTVDPDDPDNDDYGDYP